MEEIAPTWRNETTPCPMLAMTILSETVNDCGSRIGSLTFRLAQKSGVGQLLKESELYGRTELLKK